MNYAERTLIKQRSLNKNLKERIKKARYECYKDIVARGGLYENLGDKQERELLEFVVSLERNIRLDYNFFQSLKDKIAEFVNQLTNLSDKDLPAIKRFIRSYERNEALSALQSA